MQHERPRTARTSTPPPRPPRPGASPRPLPPTWRIRSSTRRSERCWPRRRVAAWSRVAYVDFNGGVDAILESLSDRLSPRILESPARLDEVRRELDEYFGGRRRDFDLDIDWSLVGPFGRRILRATAAIPFGDTLTYQQVAAKAGSPKGSRAAGNALGANPMPIVIPCHRVLRSGGGLGGYTGGIHRKQLLLGIEGHEV